METIKNAIGMGTSQQEGQEPISGETGSGDTTAPYDMGNADNKDLGGKAPQETAAADNPVANMSAADTNATGMSSPHTTDNSAPQSSEPSGGSAPAEKPAIGSASWFATAIPVRSKDAGSQQQQQQQQQQQPNGTSGVSHSSDSAEATGSAQAAQAASGVATADLPPNQIGNDPPTGASTNLDRSVHPPTKVTSDQPATTGTNRDMVGPSDTMMQGKEGHPKSREIRGSKAYAPAYERPADTNSHKREGSIPSAGGVPIGQAAFEQRRASADIRRKSQVSATGASAASSSAAAAPAATTAAAAPPAESVPATTTSAPITESTTSPPHEPAVAAPIGDPDSVAPDDTTSVPTHDPPPPSTSVPKPEPVSTSGAGVTKTDDTAKTDGKEGRRGSLFEKIKNKLKS